MKILLVNGSPKGKRSNTYRLSQALFSITQVMAEKLHKRNGEAQ